MSVAEVLKLIQEKNVQFIDYRFTDTCGKEQHLSVPANTINEKTFEDGEMFDGSSIAGWKGIHESDMTLMPASSNSVIIHYMVKST